MCLPEEGRKLMAILCGDEAVAVDAGDRLDAEVFRRFQSEAETATAWSETASRSPMTRSATSSRADKLEIVMVATECVECNDKGRKSAS